MMLSNGVQEDEGLQGFLLNGNLGSPFQGLFGLLTFGEENGTSLTDSAMTRLSMMTQEREKN